MKLELMTGHRLAPFLGLIASTFLWAATPTDIDTSRSEMRTAIERYVADWNSLTRAYPIDNSAGQRDRMMRFYREWLDRLPALDFESMSQEGRIDYLLFRNHVQHEVRQLELKTKAEAATAPFLPFAQTIVGLEESRRRMETVDPAKAAAALDALVKQVESARKSVEAGLGSGAVKKTVGAEAAAAVAGLRGTLKGWFDFYNGYDPLFTWWAAEPYKSVDANLQTYATFLRERVAGVRGASVEPAAPPVGRAGAGGRRGGGSAQIVAAQPGSSDDIVGNPIGHDGLMSELAYEMIPYTPEELIAIANKEFAWCEDQMKRASRDLGYGDDWRKALEFVKNQYVEPGKQPALIRDLANEAIAFLDQNDLITIPPLARESWRMEMMSPERQLLNPFFTGGEVISVSYPVQKMWEEQKLMSMRGNNIHFSRATVFHELIPGHHLQGFI